MPAPQPVLILNGPNLNMLGVREPTLYGKDTLADIEKRCAAHGKMLGLGVDFRQSNIEGELVTWVQQARGIAAGLIVNAGAYTHTSVALLDALKLIEVPVVEVHLSHIFRREAFRHQSYVSLAAHGMISGFGAHGYVLALDAVAALLQTPSTGS